jgi:hypothetical protein
MKFKYVLVTIFSILLFLSCTEEFEELGKDPVAISENPNGQLSFAQLSMSGDRYYQWRTNLIYSGGFTQHYSGSWNVTNFGARFKKNDDYAHHLLQISFLQKRTYLRNLL